MPSINRSHSPLVSVVVPTYNAESYIGEAIESVLSQTCSCDEIIVVDDGSIDNTWEIIRRYANEVIFIRQDRKGVSAARNRGIQQSKGTFIAFLDADDIWLPDKMSRQLAFFQQYPEVAMVFGDVEVFHDTRVPGQSFLCQKLIGRSLLAGNGVVQDAFGLLIQENYIPMPTVMVKKDVMSVVGGFDEGLKSVEDRDLWLRMSRRYQVGCIASILARVRRHQSNLSADGKIATESRIKVLERIQTEIDKRDRSIHESIQSTLAELYSQLGYHYYEKHELGKTLANYWKSLLLRYL